MRENEFIDYVENYIYDKKVMLMSGTKNIFQNIFNNLVFFEHPDGYSIDYKNKIIYVIEHFRFSSTKYKKGHGESIMIARNDMINNINNISSADDKWLEKDGYFSSIKYASGFSKLNCSNTFLLNNFNRVFNKHSQQINKYIEDVINDKTLTQCIDINDGYVFKTVFVIEESSPLGIFYIEKNQLVPFDIMMIDEFVNTIKNTKKLDYLIFTNAFSTEGICGDSYTVFYDLEKYYKKMKTYSLESKDFYFANNPTYHSLNIKVKNK